MKERPILFSAPMVRAILSGQKTLTRRAYKVGNGGVWPNLNDRPGMQQATRNCPYGQPRDRLWVRETWGVVSHTWDKDGNMVSWPPDRSATAIREMPFGGGYYNGHVIYAADGPHEWAGDDDGSGEPRSAWHPSIHMPRAASRITLEVTGVRVERLQDISEADAIAEGIEKHTTGLWLPCREEGKANIDPRLAYRDLWESINGPGSWDKNPWVWAIAFQRR